MQTLDLQRSSLRLGLYDKNSKFMPKKIVLHIAPKGYQV